MSTVNIPLEQIAEVAYRTAQNTDLINKQGITNASLADRLDELSTTDIIENVESGEYVGQGTVHLEGVLEIDDTVIKFELTYWFENDGGAKINFQTIS